MKKKVKIGDIVKPKDCIIGQYYKNVTSKEVYGHVIKDRNTIFISIKPTRNFNIIKSNDILKGNAKIYDYYYSNNNRFKRVRKPNIK